MSRQGGTGWRRGVRPSDVSTALPASATRSLACWCTLEPLLYLLLCSLAQFICNCLLPAPHLTLLLPLPAKRAACYTFAAHRLGCGPPLR